MWPFYLFDFKSTTPWNLILCLWLLHIWFIFVLSLALKYSKKCQGIRDGSQAISFRRQWVNMNRGSLHTRSFRHIHLVLFALQVALTNDHEGTGMEINNSRYDSRTCTCVLKNCLHVFWSGTRAENSRCFCFVCRTSSLSPKCAWVYSTSLRIKLSLSWSWSCLKTLGKF